MRKNVVEVGTLAALLLGTALAWGQPAVVPPPVKEKSPDQPAKSKLEEDLAKERLEVMLQMALQNNPDVRLAAAKLAEAEAELNRARLLVVRKVAVQYQAVEAQKSAVDGAAAEMGVVRTRAATGVVSQADLRAAEQRLIDAKAKLASLEAEIPYLLGQQAAGEGKMSGQSGPAKTAYDAFVGGARPRYSLEAAGAAVPAEPSVQGPTADRIRAALDKPFTYDCKEKPIADILRDMNKAFQEANPGLLIKDGTNIGEGDGRALSAHFDKMPFGAALEWVEDSINATGVGDYDVVIRDYGIAVVDHNRVPPGAPLLRDYLKRAKAEEKPPAKESPKPVSAEGVVKEVLVKSDGTPGLVRISLGLGDGVAQGDMVNVARQVSPGGRTAFVGQLRVVRVGEGESTAELVGDSKLRIEAGDHLYLNSKTSK